MPPVESPLFVIEDIKLQFEPKVIELNSRNKQNKDTNFFIKKPPKVLPICHQNILFASKMF